LIVDDDTAVAGVFARMLELEGHQVTSAHSADTGFDAAVREQPDALLVDMRMPVINGLEFLRRVRRDSRLRELPVALITGDHFLAEPILSELHALGATVRYKPLWTGDLNALAVALTGSRS
jgi:CheY-like chemotaxis protein